MTAFHTDEYIDFLSRVSPDNMENYVKEQAKCNVLSSEKMALSLSRSNTTG